MTVIPIFYPGINCLYDINTNLKTLKRMKAALDKEGLNPYLMVQPIGFRCPEVENEVTGYLALPEVPLGKCFCSVEIMNYNMVKLFACILICLIFIIE